MDPLTLTVSAFALAQLLGAILTHGAKYVKSMKHKQKNMELFLGELRSLEASVNSLSDLERQQPHNKLIRALKIKDGPIDQCQTAMRRIYSALQAFAVHNFKTWEGMKGSLYQLVWPLQEASITKVWGILERHKSSFQLALTLSNL